MDSKIAGLLWSCTRVYQQLLQQVLLCPHICRPPPGVSPVFLGSNVDKVGAGVLHHQHQPQSSWGWPAWSEGLLPLETFLWPPSLGLVTVWFSLLIYNYVLLEGHWHPRQLLPVQENWQAGALQWNLLTGTDQRQEELPEFSRANLIFLFISPRSGFKKQSGLSIFSGLPLMTSFYHPSIPHVKTKQV